MDDISAAIRSVLNDPQSMAQIQNIMQSLGGERRGAERRPKRAGPRPRAECARTARETRCSRCCPRSAAQTTTR